MPTSIYGLTLQLKNMRNMAMQTQLVKVAHLHVKTVVMKNLLFIDFKKMSF